MPPGFAVHSGSSTHLRQPQASLADATAVSLVSVLLFLVLVCCVLYRWWRRRQRSAVVGLLDDDKAEFQSLDALEAGEGLAHGMCTDCCSRQASRPRPDSPHEGTCSTSVGAHEEAFGETQSGNILLDGQLNIACTEVQQRDTVLVLPTAPGTKSEKDSGSALKQCLGTKARSSSSIGADGAFELEQRLDRSQELLVKDQEVVAGVEEARREFSTAETRNYGDSKGVGMSTPNTARQSMDSPGGHPDGHAQHAAETSVGDQMGISVDAGACQYGVAWPCSTAKVKVSAKDRVLCNTEITGDLHGPSVGSGEGANVCLFDDQLDDCAADVPPPCTAQLDDRATTDRQTGDCSSSPVDSETVPKRAGSSTWSLCAEEQRSSPEIHDQEGGTNAASPEMNNAFFHSIQGCMAAGADEACSGLPYASTLPGQLPTGAPDFVESPELAASVTPEPKKRRPRPGDGLAPLLWPATSSPAGEDSAKTPDEPKKHRHRRKPKVCESRSAWTAPVIQVSTASSWPQGAEESDVSPQQRALTSVEKPGKVPADILDLSADELMLLRTDRANGRGSACRPAGGLPRQSDKLTVASSEDLTRSSLQPRGGTASSSSGPSARLSEEQPKPQAVNRVRLTPLPGFRDKDPSVLRRTGRKISHFPGALA